MRPNIDTHDYDVKMRNMLRFFNDGDKVKVTLRFRGREMAHQDLGMNLLNKVREETSEIAKSSPHPSWKAARWSWCWHRSNSRNTVPESKNPAICGVFFIGIKRLPGKDTGQRRLFSLSCGGARQIPVRPDL